MYDDTSLTESEKLATKRLVDMLSAKILQDYSPPEIKRDAHPKQIGLVRAEFTVKEDIDEKLKIGLFKEPKTYETWIRFSNQSSTVQQDYKPDMRGAALKLVGVPGKKILGGQEDAVTQDFVLINTDVFVVQNVEQFADLVAAVVKGKLSLLLHLAKNFGTARKLFGASKRYGSILDARFWSATPYQFGSETVKYSLKPREHQPTPLPGKAEQTPNYLSHTLAKQLESGEYLYDFMVQIQKDKKKMPADDLMVHWDEKDSPFIPVATVKIPKQTFYTPQQNAYGDQLSFNPWHSLPEHTPHGPLNIARKFIYEALSALRHEKNKIALIEPTDMSVPGA